MKSSSYDGYFWEVKPINGEGINEEFEFVLVESDILPKIEANDSSFKQYFEEKRGVVSFPSLRADAQLIVPTPMGTSSNYKHLASFVRGAPTSQIIEFWKKVGEEYERLIAENIKWLSTAGLGVSWLHVRIDSRPKYYRFKEYKTIS